MGKVIEYINKHAYFTAFLQFQIVTERNQHHNQLYFNFIDRDERNKIEILGTLQFTMN